MARVKHIAIISIMEGYPWGGSEVLWSEMAFAALNQGLQVSISYKHWDEIPQPIEQLAAHGAMLYLRRTKYLKEPLLKKVRDKLNKKNTPVLKENPFQTIFDIKPDIVFINDGGFCNIMQFPHLYELLLGANIPFFTLSEQNKEFGALNSGWLMVAREIYKNAILNFFVSERNKEVAEYNLCCKLDNSKVVRNPVNLKDNSLVTYPNSEIIKLACIGRLDCDAKGQDILLRALAQLKNEFCFQLALYGTGEDILYLKDLCGFLGLTAHVKFAGHQKDVSQIWETHQLLALSSHYEGMPLVVVEAMLSGRPCLVTDVAGHTEWIEDGINGYICESPTVNALKSTLKRAFLDQANWELIGIKARQRALSLHDSNPGHTLLNLVLEDRNDQD